MLNQISKNIYIMPHNHNTDRPLLGLIVGSDYSIVVDSGNSPKHAKEFLKEVKKLNISPLKYLIITHWHWDHIFGIKEMKLSSISSKATQNILMKMKEFSWDDFNLDNRVKQGEEIEFCSENIKKEMDSNFRATFKSSTTDICFYNKLEINLGSLVCIVEKIGGSHSSDSTIIYVKDDKVMFMGDCMSEDYYSGPLNYEYTKFEAMIRKIKKYDTNLYLESHKESQKRDDFWNNINHINTIGKDVGDNTDFDLCIEKYKQKYKLEPDNQVINLIKSFIYGNLKKIK